MLWSRGCVGVVCAHTGVWVGVVCAHGGGVSVWVWTVDVRLCGICLQVFVKNPNPESPHILHLCHTHTYTYIAANQLQHKSILLVFSQPYKFSTFKYSFPPMILSDPLLKRQLGLLYICKHMPGYTIYTIA